MISSCVRDGIARQLCTWLSLLASPSPFSLLATRRSTSGNNACHMANLRIRIMGGRVHVSTVDNRQISKCGSIAVGAPGRLYNAHRHLMQFAVASLPCHITHLISSIWKGRHMQFLTDLRDQATFNAPMGYDTVARPLCKKHLTGQYSAPQMRTRQSQQCAK